MESFGGKGCVGEWVKAISDSCTAQDYFAVLKPKRHH